MLLSAARTAAYALADDDAAVRFTSTEVDDALSSAQQEVWARAVNAAPRTFEVEASVSSSSLGVVTLTSLKPARVVTLMDLIGPDRYQVKPTRLSMGVASYEAARTLKVLYVPRVTLPAAAGDPFVWGTSAITETGLFDRLMVAIAASDLLVKEGAINNALERRKDELRAALDNMVEQTAWAILPLDGYCRRGDATFLYAQTSPDVLQLVRP